jgi:hypothetical protein
MLYYYQIYVLFVTANWPALYKGTCNVNGGTNMVILFTLRSLDGSMLTRVNFLKGNLRPRSEKNNSTFIKTRSPPFYHYSEAWSWWPIAISPFFQLSMKIKWLKTIMYLENLLDCPVTRIRNCDATLPLGWPKSRELDVLRQKLLSVPPTSWHHNENGVLLAISNSR